MLKVVVADKRLPSVTAQNVGRELYHRRQDIVQIIGEERCLKKIAWIFQRVPDMFDIQLQKGSLIARRAQTQTEEQPAQAGEAKAISPVSIAKLQRKYYRWPTNNPVLESPNKVLELKEALVV
jgi:hypothetical protein